MHGMNAMNDMKKLQTTNVVRMIFCYARAAGARIIDMIFPPRPSELLVRAATDEQLMQISRVRCIQIEGVEIHTLLSYGNALVQALILEAKFHRNRHAHELLGKFLENCLRTHIKVQNAVLVPIPLGKKRRKERGYNQIEEIARFSAIFNPQITLSPQLLMRTRATHPQMELGRKARLQNMTGAFAAPG
jgi:predicted amidophosphoribosyltransferase